MSKGFALIEVLMCCLLFSLGMLGALATQIYARQQVLLATERMIASTVLADVAASLQAAGSATGSFSQIYQKLPAPVPACRSGRCAPSALAESQIQAILQPLFQTNSRLPDAQLCIVQGGALPQLQINWRVSLPAKFAAPVALCPVTAGQQHIVLSAGVP